MTNSQIKAELRRSACEDVNPFHRVKYKAFCAACEFKTGVRIGALESDDLRTFFLLVAEAL